MALQDNNSCCMLLCVRTYPPNTIVLRIIRRCRLQAAAAACILYITRMVESTRFISHILRCQFSVHGLMVGGIFDNFQCYLLTFRKAAILLSIKCTRRKKKQPREERNENQREKIPEMVFCSNNKKRTIPSMCECSESILTRFHFLLRTDEFSMV